MQRLKDAGASREAYDALRRDFPYMALDTCAADGLCATACPVDIDTGSLVKRIRQLRHSPFSNRAAFLIARRMRLAELAARFALAAGHAAQNALGLLFMQAITQLPDKASRRWMGEAFWQWRAAMPRPRRGALPTRSSEGAEAIYFPSCISRVMGALPGEQRQTGRMLALLQIADRAGVKLGFPEDAQDNCCGVPFSSKGFEAAHPEAVGHTIENFFRWSKGGELPVIVDTSPCAYGLKTARAYLSPANQAKFDKLIILDAIEFAHDRLLGKLPILRKMNSVVLHPVCSATKMNLNPKLACIAKACSKAVLLPSDAGCCGFAGDRGFLFPELTASASPSKQRRRHRKSTTDISPAAGRAKSA